MNHLQFILFIIYVFSQLSIGIGIYNFLTEKKYSILNRSVYLGETLLLGSIFFIGQLLVLSLIGLYKGLYLWSAVLLNFAFLLNKNTRRAFFDLLTKKIFIDFPLIVFIVLILIFIFRNCYFMVDVDSHSTYLFAQKLWLLAGSSLTGNIGDNVRIFLPHFDFVPASLGISIFNQETLFPELVNLFWRLIVLLLVFGYTSYRFNRYFGLAATMFVLFNDHFFYSGINKWVLINGTLIAFLFAAAYNFWESRVRENSFRFFMAIIFLSQLMANKYQMLYAFLFMIILGILIQYKPIKIIKEALDNKKWVLAVVVAFLIMSLWYVKNMIVTGNPVFPLFAGKFRNFNWTIDQSHTFAKVLGGIKPTQFIKYMNYFFIWPGINAAKYVIIAISFLPLILITVCIRQKIDRDSVVELCYWLGLSVLLTMGISIASHQDPRYYRYIIAIFSFSAVISINYILKYCLNIRRQIVSIGIILLVSLPGYKIIYQGGGFFKRPTFGENIGVLSDKIHMDYIIKKYFPQIQIILNGLNDNKEKLKTAAWGVGTDYNFPAFLLPRKPMVSLWFTTIIKWDSYDSEDSIVNNLRNYGIKWIMALKDNKLIFTPIEEYAREAVKYERHPEKILYDYGFPPELSHVEY